MKTLLLVLLVSLSITGCYKSCAVGDPLALFTYCPKDAYERLRNPKPFGARWVKEGMTRESRKADWVACGGGENLSNGFRDWVKPETWESFYAGLEAHEHSLFTCMKSKGYAYRNPQVENKADQCDDGACLYP